jgi:hypothetical protein
MFPVPCLREMRMSASGEIGSKRSAKTPAGRSRDQTSPEKTVADQRRGRFGGSGYEIEAAPILARQ